MTYQPNSMEARDIAYQLHSYTDARKHQQDGPLIIERGEGIYVYDSNGKRYIEGMAGLWSVAVGFGEKRLVEAASRQTAQLPDYHTFTHKAHPLVVEGRSVGLIGALELHHEAFASRPGMLGTKMNAAMQERGLISRNMGDAMAFCPPLIVTATKSTKSSTSPRTPLRRSPKRCCRRPLEPRQVYRRRPKSDRIAPKVMALIAEGRSYRWIARDMAISKNTVAEIVKRTQAPLI